MWLWVQFPLVEMKYLIFSFPRSVNYIYHGEFRHSTQSTSKIRRKVGEGSHNEDGVSYSI